MPLPILPKPIKVTFISALHIPYARTVKSFAEFFQFRYQFRQSLLEIGNQTVVGDLEDRRPLVRVDGDDNLLMATIILESFIPASCWMAPEISTAM